MLAIFFIVHELLVCLLNYDGHVVDIFIGLMLFLEVLVKAKEIWKNAAEVLSA